MTSASEIRKPTIKSWTQTTLKRPNKQENKQITANNHNQSLAKPNNADPTCTSLHIMVKQSNCVFNQDQKQTKETKNKKKQIKKKGKKERKKKEERKKKKKKETKKEKKLTNN